MTQIIPTLLLPMGDSLYMVPSATVAEIIPFKEMDINFKQEGLISGTILWRGISLPIVDFGFNTSLSNNLYIAVLNRLSGNTRFDFFGLILNSYPKIKTIIDENLTVIEEADNSNKYIAYTGMVESTPFKVLNLLYCWEKLNAL